MIAIDPGAGGGVAVSVFGVIDARPMPATGGDLLALLRCLKDAADKSGVETVCVLEQAGGFDRKAPRGPAMFKLGEDCGFIKGATQAIGIRLVLVRPQTWRKVFGLGTAASCANSREWKNRLKAEAQRRFPNYGATLQTAEALLILEWAREFQAQRPRKMTAVLFTEVAGQSCN